MVLPCSATCVTLVLPYCLSMMHKCDADDADDAGLFGLHPKSRRGDRDIAWSHWELGGHCQLGVSCEVQRLRQMRAETEPPGPWGPPAYPEADLRSESCEALDSEQNLPWLLRSIEFILVIQVFPLSCNCLVYGFCIL